MKRSFLLLLVFCFSALPAAGQQAEYMITESELTKLESLLEKWENIKQVQLSQIQNLETELNEALKYQESLTNQLTQARQSLRKSEKSFAEYEKESMELIAKKEDKIQKKQTEIDGLKTKNYRLKLLLIIVSGVLIVILLGFGFYGFLRLKKAVLPFTKMF